MGNVFLCVEKFFFYHKAVTLPEGWWLCLLSLCLSWTHRTKKTFFFPFSKRLALNNPFKIFVSGIWWMIKRGYTFSAGYCHISYSISLFLSSFSAWPMEPPRSSQGNNNATFTQVPLGLQIPPQTSESRNFFGRNTMLPWKNSI